MNKHKVNNKRNWNYNMKKLKKIGWILTYILLSIFCETECYAKDTNNTSQENKVSSLYAQSAVLMDGSSGRVLYEKNGEDFLANASTTKILTCILALENAELTDIVNVSSYAASMPDVQLHIKEGERYYLGDLLYSLMLESHNDVAVAIAEHVSGSQEEFSKLMNRKAKEIGCENTTFLTPNGLDATQKISVGLNSRMKEISHGTTATDLALIMRYCIKLSPKKEQFLQITRTPSYSFTNIDRTRNFYCRNHNAFLNMMDGALSGKTGFTGKAGYCYVGALEREGRYYIVALLACGWPNNKTYKWSDCRKLMEYGVEEYRLVPLEQLEAGFENELTTIVKNAKREDINQDASIQLKREKSEITEVLLEEEEEITTQVIKKELTAPVRKNETAGVLTYYIEGEKWLEEALLVKEKVEEIDFEWCLEQVAGKMFN